MVDPAEFLAAVRREGIEFLTGVPDSLLKDFCGQAAASLPSAQFITAANEGNAIALAAGWYLGTGGPALVYLQNSGLGNAINPLLTLVDRDVYRIPMLLLIGWRGEPGVSDEPQHAKQGRLTIDQLKLLGIPTQILDRDSDLSAVLKDATTAMRQMSAPSAIVVRDGTFTQFTGPREPALDYPMTREEAIRLVAGHASAHDVVVASTGHASRELYESRQSAGEGNRADFLVVGSMGHASSIALGLALSQTRRRIYCLDGDGALLMHMGMLPVIGDVSPDNLVHIVLNNGAHDSVGGQPTAARSCALGSIASACGYPNIYRADDAETLAEALRIIADSPGLAFVEVRVRGGSRKDLGRPKRSPLESRRDFMRQLEAPEFLPGPVEVEAGTGEGASK